MASPSTSAPIRPSHPAAPANPDFTPLPPAPNPPPLHSHTASTSSQSRARVTKPNIPVVNRPATISETQFLIVGMKQRTWQDIANGVGMERGSEAMRYFYGLKAELAAPLAGSLAGPLAGPLRLRLPGQPAQEFEMEDKGIERSTVEELEGMIRECKARKKALKGELKMKLEMAKLKDGVRVDRDRLKVEEEKIKVEKEKVTEREENLRQVAVENVKARKRKRESEGEDEVMIKREKVKKEEV